MRVLLGLVAALALAAPAHAAPAIVKLGDFAQPTYATSAPGDSRRVFVTERAGRIRLVLDGVVQPDPFLDLRAVTESGYVERGLLSMAFAPDYAASGRFYVYLTAAGSGEIRILEYRRSADPGVADPATGRTILAIPHAEAANHNGGQLQFGPDGELYAATGDGGGANDQYHHSQDPASRLGKLVRLDVAQPTPAPEILGRGLRNPWRFSFDPSGRIVIGDVGQGAVEEVDVGVAANYGWPCLEGTRANVPDDGCQGVATAPPVLEVPHSGTGFCAIVGGYVVRDPGLPTLLGRYLFGDNCATGVFAADLATGAYEATGVTVGGLSSFGEDACGRILVVSLSGPVYRLLDGPPSACAGEVAALPSPTPTATPAVSPAAPAPAPAADRRPAKVTAALAGLRRGRLALTLRADEPCRVTLAGRVAGVSDLRRRTVALRAGRTAVAVRLAHPRAVRAALRRHGRLIVRLRVRTVDAAGNAATLVRRLRLR